VNAAVDRVVGQGTAGPAPRAVHEGTPRVRFGAVPPVWLAVASQLDLLAVVLALFACLVAFEEPLTLEYAVLGAVAAMLTARFVTTPDLARVLEKSSAARVGTARVFVEWMSVAGLIAVLGLVLEPTGAIARLPVLAWLASAPLVLFVSHAVQAGLARRFATRDLAASRYVVVGVNPVGQEVVARLSGASCLGFFDYRSRSRLGQLPPGVEYAGHCAELAGFVHRQGVRAVYVALPVGNSPRLRDLLADLQDTTASVYFVPDLFAFSLIQARVVDLNGLPALAVCDTPLHGSSAAAKRLMDVVVSALALIVLAPVLVAVAIAVKAGSPGPVLFRQRRYGLDGREIVVRKFRTMTVLEDGTSVLQATRADRRVTRVGRVLRRTSIDELPQLWNVLEGSMSLVGPRPHAVAHNEQYRRLISGYMIRHKVRPGITGWAQVHGFRGETDTLEKMAERVRYDLDYLQHWSLGLDLRILASTARIVLGAQNAW
jgi:putative colanic acid biosynthesis UDP-glucose lipid carrier transferase